MRTRQNTLRPYTSAVARDRAAFVESARRAIPIGTYLQMLNHAVLTGEMPIADPMTGQLTSQTDKITTDQRMDLAKYLINKALPDLIRVEPAGDDGLKDASTDNIGADDLSKLPTDSIRALIEAQRILAAKPATPESLP